MNIEDMEIIAQIEAQENIAYGVNDSALSNDRAEAIDYYLGQYYRIGAASAFKSFCGW
jgi:hypothetical protein